MFPENDRIIVHGVLMSVFGCGTLILGESGIGKSLLALELLAAGHRLVADDAVELHSSADKIIGRAPALTRGLLAVKCVGLMDVTSHFGDCAVLDEASVELCIELTREPPVPAGGLLSADKPSRRYFNIDVPVFQLGVSAGSRLAVIVEAAVHVHRHGDETANRLFSDHRTMLSAAAANIPKPN